MSGYLFVCLAALCESACNFSHHTKFIEIHFIERKGITISDEQKQIVCVDKQK